MKLNKLAAAVAFAVIGAPAFATIQTNNDAEMVFVAFDSAGSYALDLGITMDQFMASSSSAAGYNLSVALGSAAWTSFLGADNALAADTKWALLATDVVDANSAVPGDLRLLSTKTAGTVVSNFQNGDWSVSMQQVGDKFVNTNGTGTHVGNANGDSFNAVGSLAYFPQSDSLGSLNYNMGIAVGSTSNMFLSQRSNEFDDTTPIVAFAQGNAVGLGVASFNGTSLSYSVPVSAVPEPGAIGLLLAGLSALGFIGGRRRNDD